jgi:hypothetical protein
MFDLKPGHENGGPFKEIQTATPGIRISEHLSKIARHMDKMALIRSMSTKEGEHARAAAEMRTGYAAEGPIRFPLLGSLVAKELGDDGAALPHFVQIGLPNFVLGSTPGGAGFLGPRYAPLLLGDQMRTGEQLRPSDAEHLKSLRITDLTPDGNVTPEDSKARIELLQQMQKDFEACHKGLPLASRHTAYDRALRLLQTSDAEVFDLQTEPEKSRDAYGTTRFGQGCLLARRLVEKGVPFVEVSGTDARWDSHSANFQLQKEMSELIDTPWAALLEDLKQRGLLDSTLVIWMGEFGRTPKINGSAGRDHFPLAWTTVLCGGGIKTGQVIGRTGKDGMSVEDRPVSLPDFLATVCQALGIDHTRQNVSNIGRSIRIVDKSAKPISELLG